MDGEGREEGTLPSVCFIWPGRRACPASGTSTGHRGKLTAMRQESGGRSDGSGPAPPGTTPESRDCLSGQRWAASMFECSALESINNNHLDTGWTLQQLLHTLDVVRSHHLCINT